MFYILVVFLMRMWHFSTNISRAKVQHFGQKARKKNRKVWSFTKKYVILHPETHCEKTYK